MAIIGKRFKQPREVQDYNISFVAWLAALNDTALSIEQVLVDSGITLDTSRTPLGYTMTAGVVKVWLSGGTDQVDYKVTVRILTAGGRKKEDELLILVRET